MLLRPVPLPASPKRRLAAVPLPERDRSNSLDSLDGLTSFTSTWTINDEDDEDEGYEGSDGLGAFPLDLDSPLPPAPVHRKAPDVLPPLLIPSDEPADAGVEMELDDDTPSHTPHALAPARPRTLLPRRPALFASSSSSSSSSSTTGASAPSPTTPTMRLFAFPLHKPLTNVLRRTTSFTLPPALARTRSTLRNSGARSVQPSPTRDRRRRADDDDGDEARSEDRDARTGTPRKKRKLLRL